MKCSRLPFFTAPLGFFSAAGFADRRDHRVHIRGGAGCHVSHSPVVLPWPPGAVFGWGIVGGRPKGTRASGWKPLNTSNCKPKQPQVIFSSALSNFAVRERALQPRGSTGFSQP